MAQHTLKGTTTAGTPVVASTFLAAGTNTRFAWAIIQWKSNSQGNMYVGDNLTPKPFSANTPAVSAGNSVTLPFTGVPGLYDFRTLLIDSDSSGDFLILYGRG